MLVPVMVVMELLTMRVMMVLRGYGSDHMTEEEKARGARSVGRGGVREETPFIKILKACCWQR